eukprot:1118313-Rhodomonas_salina.1
MSGGYAMSGTDIAYGRRKKARFCSRRSSSDRAVPLGGEAGCTGCYGAEGTHAFLPSTLDPGP